jgi:hypothetical protein
MDHCEIRQQHCRPALASGSCLTALMSKKLRDTKVWAANANGASYKRRKSLIAGVDRTATAL